MVRVLVMVGLIVVVSFVVCWCAPVVVKESKTEGEEVRGTYRHEVRENSGHEFTLLEAG